jgi:hypothetical protein
MSVPDKGHRIYPYSNGLLLGTEADIVLTTENSEPVDAGTLFKAGHKYETAKTGGNETNPDEGKNHFIVKDGMIKLVAKFSYCRGYSTDNVWWIMKELVALLKKRAFLSSVPCFLAEDFMPSRNDGMSYVAGGTIKTYARCNDIYNQSTALRIRNMTSNKTDESHKRHLDNMRLIIGIVSTLLDRREAAEYRRTQFAPGEKNEFIVEDTTLKYLTPTNFWLFSPALTHLMLGLTRMVYFVTLNGLEPEIWEGFEPGDVHNAIRTSDYEVAEEIWHMIKGRLGESGYQPADNPVWQHRAMILDFLLKNKFDVMGAGIYKNWQMARKRETFAGHFNQLPSWEAGMPDKVFSEKHARYKEFITFRDSYAKREKERTSL